MTKKLKKQIEEKLSGSWVLQAKEEDEELRIKAKRHGEEDRDVTPEEGVEYLLPEEVMKSIGLEMDGTFHPPLPKRKIGLREEAIEVRMKLAEKIIKEVADLEGEETSPLNILNRLGNRAVEDFVEALNKKTAASIERAAASGMPVFDL